MMALSKIKLWIFGPPRNPMDPKIRRHIALTALLAWIGLGADGLSSSAYGPEQAFIALGSHHNLALYLSFAIAITVFIISLSYNQVIELFPSGGGGYKVATKLLNPYLGLLSGAALIVDYILTITISIAGGVDALFSFLPNQLQPFKLFTEIICVILLMMLNLRGMKESIRILMPIFIGFMITHVLIIFYGIFAHHHGIATTVSNTFSETVNTTHSIGFWALLLLLLKAYSLGGGTYTGLEAVSNNVNTLAEPRVATGKWTMFYMASSLSITAGGIMLLYLIWQVHPIMGKTLNAVVFSQILGHIAYGKLFLLLLLIFEAGLLFVGANTGFLGGPAVLANMALDSWVPIRFRSLSNRLVTQNGILFFGISALFFLIWSHGHVDYLVVLYSIDVFLTFSLSLLSLCKYWITYRAHNFKSIIRLLLSFLGLAVCLSILCITTISKFFSGGWFTILITGLIVIAALLIKKYYNRVAKRLKMADEALDQSFYPIPKSVNTIDPTQPTAVFFIDEHRSIGLQAIATAQRLFPNQFKNFIFVRIGIIDVGNFLEENGLKNLQQQIEKDLLFFKDYASQLGMSVKSYQAYGTDPVVELTHLAKDIHKEFSSIIFFASQIIISKQAWIRRVFHGATATTLQHRLHLESMTMILLPIQLPLKALSFIL